MIQYYSGGCQDKWVLSILKEKRNGFFVEIGGADGMLQSNTYTMEYYYDWSGILIEPTPSLYNDMVKNRKCICDNSCIDDTEHEIEYVVADGHIQGLGGIKSCIRHPKSVDMNNIIKLNTTTLFNVFKKYNIPNIIDYFSLDVEGSEYNVLKKFPFDEYKFRCITVEMDECNDILLNNGYIKTNNPFIKNTCDKYFVNKDLVELT